MKKPIRIIAATLLVGAVTFWVIAGANRGWTKTRVPQKVVDAVTGLEGVQWQDRFVPGVDFLAMAVFGSGILGIISLFVGRNSK